MKVSIPSQMINNLWIFKLIFFPFSRLELGIGEINQQTKDPFTKNKLNDLWTPVEFVNKLDENLFDLFNQPIIYN